MGYARVSTLDQNPALQQAALEKAGCERIFTDTASGARTDRPQLAAALAYVRSGDTLVVWKLDRLGRSLSHLIETVKLLRERGVEFISLTERIDTTTPGGKLVFHIFGAIAEFERDLIRERTNAGLAAARARGHVGGGKHLLSPKQAENLRTAHQAKTDQGQPRYTIADLCDMFRVSRATLYRYLR